MPDLGDYSQVEKLLAVEREDGLKVLQVGLLATVYFRESGSQHVRMQAAGIVEDYRNAFKEHLRWERNPKTLKFQPIGSSKLPSASDWLSSLGETEEWTLELRGGESADAADHFSLLAYGAPPLEGGLSFLKVTLPLTWFADHNGSFSDILLIICKRLVPYHGYGGAGILESPNRALRAQYEPTVYAIADRFPGLEVDVPATHSVFLEDRIKGGGWLTVLSNELVVQLGGVDNIHRQVPSAQVLQYNGGIVVQLGKMPKLGDKQRGSRPEEYVALAKLLRPIRVTRHSAFHQAGPGLRLDKQRSMAWLARFDS